LLTKTLSNGKKSIFIINLFLFKWRTWVGCYMSGLQLFIFYFFKNSTYVELKSENMGV